MGSTRYFRLLLSAKLAVFLEVISPGEVGRAEEKIDCEKRMDKPF